MRNALLAAILGLFGSITFNLQSATACIPTVRQVNLFEVFQPNVKTIEAKTGDYIKFTIRTPKSINPLNNTSSINYNNTSGLKLIDSVVKNLSWPQYPGATDEGGTFYQKEYTLYFKVEEPGSNKITIGIEDENGSASAEQEYIATERPIKRSC